MMSGALVRKRVFLALVLLFLLYVPVSASARVGGTVYNQEGLPVNASIHLFDEKQEIVRVTAGSNGVFSLDVPTGNYTIIIYADDPATEGFDYVPSEFKIEDEFDSNITLVYGSSILFTGEFQFIDTENIPLNTVYIVQDDWNNTLSPGGFSLEFSDKNSGGFRLPSLGKGEVIVPADTQVDVCVNISILIESQIKTRSFQLDDLSTPNRGGLMSIDVREYTIPISKSIAVDARERLESRLTEMEEYGFYLAKQEAALSKGIKYLDDAENLYANGDFDESFGSLKHGYILFIHTHRELVTMYSDARFSVYVLIAFLTTASLITGYLLVDGFIQQAAVDLVIMGGGLLFFFKAYPGSRTIPLSNFILASGGFFLFFMISGKLLPRLFRGMGSEERVHTRNLIAPIFNIARRSLRRRRLRFLLTFISITLLVMSFVTLTSFSEGYGLITGESSPKSGWRGVYIREGNWSPEDPTFILLTEGELNWLKNQPEADLLSPKAENIPLKAQLLTIKEQPIFGIMGITGNETYFSSIQRTLISGELPRGDGVLISESFSQSTGLSIGNQLQIGLKEFTVDGVYRDEAFRKLKDLDGTPYTPNKWINVSPEGEAPNWALEETAPHEILIMSTEKALEFPTVGVQRIAIDVNPSYNATDFAERLALERGYRAWANTLEAYSSYRLGNYFQGKGATLVIPWIIVVLNVVVTMLNSLYERRKEIEILSSVGLNPAQVSSIFVAEAVITGFIAGGFGYLIGLGFYKALAILNIGLQVHQKVSAVWSLAAIGLAISAVVAGAFAALKNSVVITPSLMRRWKLDRTTGGYQEPWRIEIPIKLEPSEVKPYLDYVESRLVRLKIHPTQVTSSIKRLEDKIDFVYKSVQTSTGNFYTKNTLSVYSLDDDMHGVLLESIGESDWVHVVGSLIRRISMNYSTDKRD